MFSDSFSCKFSSRSFFIVNKPSFINVKSDKGFNSRNNNPSSNSSLLIMYIELFFSELSVIKLKEITELK